MLLRVILLVTVIWFEAAAASSRVELFLSHSEARPGSKLKAAIRINLTNSWHAYWRNPGFAGQPPSVNWIKPNGIEISQAEWPVPEKIEQHGFYSYIYSNEVIILFPVQIAPDQPAGNVEIIANVDWLECKDMCVSASGKASANLKIGDQLVESKSNYLFREWEKRLPINNPGLPIKAFIQRENQSSFVVIAFTNQSSPVLIDFYQYPEQTIKLSDKTTYFVSDTAKGIKKRIESDTQVTSIDLYGLLVLKKAENDPKEYYEIKIQTSEVNNQAQASSIPGLVSKQGRSFTGPGLLLLNFFLGIIGGVILNFMPCVLPVIALKILGFIQQSGHDNRSVRLHGIVFSLGVLVSFIILALIIIFVQQTGKSVGWGMQFGNPRFIVVLTLIISLVAFNLFGLFEITISGKVLNGAVELSSKKGLVGAFFSGILATVLATPCSAPILGSALGYALVQPGFVIIIIFLSIAIGFALPYLLLCFNPSWLRLLPKPGLWMEHFKKAMGFPMLATSVWLYVICFSFYGKKNLWLGLFIVLLAFLCWFYGTFIQQGQARKNIKMILVLLVLLVGYFTMLEQKMDWRYAGSENNHDHSAKTSKIDWKPWSNDAVAQARKEGKIVLIDFTADWCLTCQFNKKFALEVPSVISIISNRNVETFLADYTKTPPEITQELKKFGKAGVPLVIVYPPGDQENALVLPELLTPSAVISAIEKAIAISTNR